MELSLLLAFMTGSSSFSHIVLISVLWLRCGCVKAAGGFRGRPWLSSALNTPCNQRSYSCHLAGSLGLPFLHISSVLPSMSCPPSLSLSPPLRFSASLLSSRKTLVSGKWWSSCHLCFGHPPLPRAIVAEPSFVCVCFTAAVKDKKQSLPPPLLFSGRMSLSFPQFLCPRWTSEQLPLQRLAMLSAFSHFLCKGE